MAVCSQSYDGTRGTNPAKGFIFILLFAILGGLVLFSMAHAIEKHGDVAIQICQSPSLKIMHRPIDGRKAHICQLDDGKFGIKICDDKDCVVTAFRNKGASIGDVIKYLSRKGYY